MAIFNDKFYNGKILFKLLTILYCVIGQIRLSVLRFPFREQRPLSLAIDARALCDRGSAAGIKFIISIKSLISVKVGV